MTHGVPRPSGVRVVSGPHAPAWLLPGQECEVVTLVVWLVVLGIVFDTFTK